MQFPTSHPSNHINISNSIQFRRSLRNPAKSIKKIPKILFFVVRYKISFCYWWSVRVTKTSYHSKLCGEEFLYGFFWIPEWPNCNEMYVCQILCQWSMDVIFEEIFKGTACKMELNEKLIKMLWYDEFVWRWIFFWCCFKYEK